MEPIVVDAKCPRCKVSGIPSVVYLVSEWATLAAFSPFHDAEGRQHLHDTNYTTKSYKCSMGHAWSEQRGPAPCWCGFPGNEEDD